MKTHLGMLGKPNRCALGFDKWPANGKSWH
jgi:hypothetical protein